MSLPEGSAITGMIGQWRGEIAHPDFADWVTVAAYCIAAILAARAARSAMGAAQSKERLVWRLSIWILLLLAVNELLDLQLLLTILGRADAKASGWYEGRRMVQYAFVIALGGCALIVGATLLWLTRHMHNMVRLAFAGFVFIGLFILARASSIHHLEQMLGRGPETFNVGSMQEMAGIVIVAVAAALYARAHRSERPSEIT